MRGLEAEAPRRVVGLTGAPAVGKGEVAAFLKEWAEDRGWTVGRLGFSDEIKEEVRAQGTPEADMSRETLTRAATQMREADGPGVLAGRIIRRIESVPPAERPDMYVVEAIRHVAEIDLLREAFGQRFALVAVTADLGIVAERLLARARPDESRQAMRGAAEAREVLQGELDGAEGPNAFRISACMERADARIVNDGTLDDLRGRVREFAEGFA